MHAYEIDPPYFSLDSIAAWQRHIAWHLVQKKALLTRREFNVANLVCYLSRRGGFVAFALRMLSWRGGVPLHFAVSASAKTSDQDNKSSGPLSIS